ncbi:MAG: hypothetical protein LBS75_02270 [Synergistaceae bacterium]|nr:hypothetical protein [Synergistaceae bacterium]
MSKRFDGFESETRAVEVVVVNIKSDFDGIVKNFTELSLKSRGVELRSRGDLVINGGRAVLFKAFHPDGDRNWGKWILLSENGGNTLVVNGIFVSGDAEAAEDVEAMFKSLFLDIASFDAVPASYPASGDALPMSGDIPQVVPDLDWASAITSSGDLVSNDESSADASSSEAEGFDIDSLLLGIYYDRASSADGGEKMIGSEDAAAAPVPVSGDVGVKDGGAVSSDAELSADVLDQRRY